jgi:hypothetical protein
MENTFLVEKHCVKLTVRWRFDPTPDAHERGVEFLSVDVEFDPSRPEICWYWYHEEQIEVIVMLYQVAEGKSSTEEFLDWLGEGFDRNYRTTKEERKLALECFVELNNHLAQKDCWYKA